MVEVNIRRNARLWPKWVSPISQFKFIAVRIADKVLIYCSAEDWLNDGMKGSGWTAPFLPWSSLVKINRTTFYSGVGSACQQYNWAFQQSGDGHGIDPVFLAFIAMQESSCNADAGEFNYPQRYHEGCTDAKLRRPHTRLAAGSL
jgi:hypothetical protein